MLPNLRVIRGLCLKVLLGTWEPDPFLDDCFLIGNNSCSVSHKVDTELGQAPESQAIPRDTDHLRLSNLAARTRSAVKCYVRKTCFFAAVEQNEKPEPCVGFNTTKGNTCFVSVFRSHNCWPQTDDNGNAFSFQTIQKRNRLKIRSYRRYEENGKNTFVVSGLFVHAAVRGGTCAFTLKIVNTLIQNTSRNDMPSIPT